MGAALAERTCTPRELRAAAGAAGSAQHLAGRFAAKEAFIKAFGIDPQAHRVVALKSAQHFRAAFEPIAGAVIVCDSGALAGPDCTTRKKGRSFRWE